MDQTVVAAIAGAAVGSIGSTLAAVWTGRQARLQTEAQMKGQHAQWRREARRAAFADVIRACAAIQMSCKKAAETILDARADSAVVAERMASVRDSSAPLHDARIIATLEAPELSDALADLFDRHVDLQVAVADLKGQRTTFGAVIDKVITSSASTAAFVDAAQHYLNSYDG
ncbi:hypothetical protein [Streptomyces edwardsiae]|uniref:Uncharacterized protein n=1 Tax=Streptomyces edwardsiae TaxID=3075527 RepID=A0ABU2PTC1_9ACTN|nr:hypothetical protein [Streptomyces sp. DSM 41636]MDT0394244.1 hypothetical protein [Streptomyces sp. DSM 41636]